MRPSIKKAVKAYFDKPWFREFGTKYDIQMQEIYKRMGGVVVDTWDEELHPRPARIDSLVKTIDENVKQ